jgi:hypothetical protein
MKQKEDKMDLDHQIKNDNYLLIEIHYVFKLYISNNLEI